MTTVEKIARLKKDIDYYTKEVERHQFEIETARIALESLEEQQAHESVASLAGVQSIVPK